MRKLITFVLVSLILAISVVGSSALADQGHFQPIAAYQQVGRSREALSAYRSVVEGKIDRLSREVGADEKVRVTATFTKPLAKAEVLALASRHNVEVESVIGRAIERGSGLRATLMVGLYDEAILKGMLQRNDAEFQGFIEAVVSVPNKNLRALAFDEVVFLADPSADGHLISNSKRYYVPGVFWKLEDFGLVPR